MFGGIVEAIGKIANLQDLGGCKVVTISPNYPFKDIQLGESVAVNGVCLSVTGFTDVSFTMTIVPETLRRTNLGHLKVGSEVNLERALTPNMRMSGHCVQGHVDDVGEILEIIPDNSDALLAKISIPQRLAKYIVNKGYIAIDGMSITVIESTPDWFTVTFIPHTQAVTITKGYEKGSLLNLEIDIFGKYVERFMEAYHARQ